MYTIEQEKQLKKAFWTKFGQYLKPIPSAWNPKVNWVNYHTGINGLYFKMDATRNYSFIGIVATQKSIINRAEHFNHLQSLQGIFNSHLQEDWHWEETATHISNTVVSAVYTQLQDVDVLQEAHWPTIISFLKPRIIALDAFWADVKDSF